jgi:transmembrane sensor
MEVKDKALYVHKHLTGELTPEEEAFFEIWRGEEENEKVYQQIYKIWSQPKPAALKFDYNAALNKHLAMLKNDSLELDSEVDNVIEINTETRVDNVRRLPIRWISAVAALFALVFAATFLLNRDKLDTTFSASQATLASLKDGSKVHLNQGSVMDVFEFGNTRKVNLKGEAFFNVASDISKPFVIETEQSSIKVVGTEFTVSTIDNEVKVKEGIVEVTVGDEKVTLKKDERVKYIGGKLQAKENSSFDNASLWFNNELTFNNTPFDKVIEELSKYFKVTINLPKQRDWSGCTFTAGSLKGNSLDEILVLLQLTYQLEYEKNADGSYKLSKVKCK